MKTQNTGLIFCSQYEQKSPINIETIKYFNSNRVEIGNFFEQYFVIQDEEFRAKLKKYFQKNSLNQYHTFLRLIHSISPCNQEVNITISKNKTFFNEFRYSTRSIKKSKVGRQKMFGNVNWDFVMNNNGYGSSLRQILNDNQNLDILLSNSKSIKLIKKPKVDHIEKVTTAVKTIKDNVFNNFSQLVTNFFNDILGSVIPSLSRRDLKNEIQIVGSKTYRAKGLIIDIPYERLAVINFIKKLGLEQFYSEHLNIPRMVEAIRMYELGEHRAFKEYTTYAVNRALIAIERKLLEFNEEQRYIALQEMNNLDSLKFIVELITDDELLENNLTLNDYSYLALPYKI